MDRAKPFDIPKREVWEAYKRVRANKGTAGVDGQSIADFEADLSNNLYKLWNRMSSGSYYPPPVRRVDIPKGDGRTRPLGIPTVADRVAQTVVKRFLEPLVEPHFHDDSYGYRPNKSVLDAVGRARQRCWRHPWVLDLDIKAFFDSIDSNLLMRAVRKHTDCAWVLLFIERWLKAPEQMEDGSLIARERGTPQGGVISPLLANLFLHYTFDLWMRRNHPDIPFERYADDVICHCRSEEQARNLNASLERRFAAARQSRWESVLPHPTLLPSAKLVASCKCSRRIRSRPVIYRTEVARVAGCKRGTLTTYDMTQTVKLLEELRESRLRLPVLLGVMCGLRRGEIVALRWSHIDLAAGKMMVVESAEQTAAGIRYKPPKSGRGRTVALSAMVTAELRQHRLAQAEELLRLGVRSSDATFVYTRQDGEPMQPRSLSQMWSTITTTLPRIRFHDLRHAHATHMLAAGVHPKVASERLGHSRVGITLDLYSHVLPGMQEDAAARVDEAYQIAEKRRAENIG